MKKTIAWYALALGLLAFGLSQLEFRYQLRTLDRDIYVALIAIGFTVLGVWIGTRVSGSRRREQFTPNQEARQYLRISDREMEVLELLAAGHTNQQIGDRLFVSENTVKTHLKHLYEKLEVRRRTQAVNKARELRLVP